METLYLYIGEKFVGETNWSEAYSTVQNLFPDKKSKIRGCMQPYIQRTDVKRRAKN